MNMKKEQELSSLKSSQQRLADGPNQRLGDSEHRASEAERKAEALEKQNALHRQEVARLRIVCEEAQQARDRLNLQVENVGLQFALVTPPLKLNGWSYNGKLQPYVLNYKPQNNGFSRFKRETRR